MKLNQLISFCFATGFSFIFAQNISGASEPFILKAGNTEDVVNQIDLLHPKISLPNITISNLTNGSVAVGANNDLSLDLFGIKDALTLQVTTEGYLINTAVNGGIKYVTIAQALSNPVALLTEDPSYATPGFSISGGHLALNGSDTWSLSVNSTNLLVKVPGAPLIGNDTVNIPLKLDALSNDGNTLSDYSPSVTISSGANFNKRDVENDTWNSTQSYPNITSIPYGNSTQVTTTVTYATTVLEKSNSSTGAFYLSTGYNLNNRQDLVSQISDGQVQATSSGGISFFSTSSPASVFQGGAFKSTQSSGIFALLCLITSFFA